MLFFFLFQIEARVTSEPIVTPPLNQTLTQGKYCAFFSGSPKDSQVIDFQCPTPGILGSVAVLYRIDHRRISTMEIQVLGK